jgi:hypothetical protein
MRKSIASPDELAITAELSQILAWAPANRLVSPSCQAEVGLWPAMRSMCSSAKRVLPARVRDLRESALLG